MEKLSSLSTGKSVATMVGLSLGVLMSALDTTIVGTAMPGITRDLGGMGLYSWPFTAYLVCSTVATMVFGKLSDAWGRRAVFLGALAWFLASSTLCGAARSMGAFIAFRGLQGAGGGVLISTAFAIVGEAFPPRERGKYMGMIGGMFGIASIIGPTMGGLITDGLGWSWVFYINLPLGLAAAAVLSAGMAGRAERKSKARLDWAGLTLFVAAVVPLLLGLSLGGKNYAWTSPPVIALFATAAAAGVGLGLVERSLYSRRAEPSTPGDAAAAAPPAPFLPIAFFKDREYSFAAAGSFFSNAVFFAGILLIPLYLQRVLGSSATGSGLAITPLVLSYTISSVAAGQLISRRAGYRGLAIASSILALAALIPLCLLSPSWGRTPVVLAMLLLGAALGATTPVYQIAAQGSVDPRSIGAVTASVQFFRSLGSTVGSAVYGAVMSGSLQAMLRDFDWGQSPDILKSTLGNPQILLNGAAVEQVIAKVPAQYGGFIAGILGRLDRGLASAISAAFVAALAFGLCALASCLAFGKDGRVREPRVVPGRARP
jgi:EmrB/QacA subfamily drug resistance transporter